MRDLALLFDLDGTLSDPREGIEGCLRFALRKLGHPEPDPTRLEGVIGPPLRHNLARLLRTSDPKLIESGVAHFRRRFSAVGMFENALYPGIAEALDEIADAAQALFVATAKPHVYARRILQHFELERHFTRVYGPELDGTFDLKSELLGQLIAREGLDPARSVMIGDRASDVLAAAMHGVRTVGVLWGYGSVQELRQAGAAMLCSDPAALPEVLRDLADA
jgi:phosphoglycolate phosphatase